MIRLTLAGLLTVAALGVSAVAAKDPVEACDHAKTRTAEQHGKTITIVVTGEHPTTGWKTWLKKVKGDAMPPEFSLTHQKPEGKESEVVTPFEVKEKFDTERALETIVVLDHSGRHEVKVTQAPK